jgi:DNA uptake protein ComE-like DNA-binding protein
VISVLAGLTAIVVTFAATQLAWFRAASDDMDRTQARLMAEAGLERALAELAVPPENPAAATRQDGWHQLGLAGDVRFLVGQGSFRLDIVDAGSLVNLNLAPEAQIARLPLTNEQIDSLLDWRSGEDPARPEGGKDEFYNALENPYNAALTRLETLDELFLIKGFSASTLYERSEELVNTQPLAPGGPEDQPLLAEIVTVRSTSPELTPDGQTKLNINTASTQQMVQRGLPNPVAAAIVQRRNTQGTFARLGDVFLTPGVTLSSAATILDQFQVGTATEAEGRVNLNTASEAVLNSVPGFTPDVASSVVSRQSFGMTRLGELAELPGVSLPMLQECADQVTVGASTFLVRVVGSFGSGQSFLEATVRVENGVPRVLHRWSPPVADPLTLWRWQPEPSSEVDLGGTP